MFKYIQDILWGPEESKNLLLEDAYKILQRAEEEEVADEESDDNNTTNQKYQITHATGTITNSGNNSYEIDNKYKFTSEDMFTIGMKVSFTIYCNDVTNLPNKITNVKEIADEWGLENVKTGDGSWCIRTINVEVVSRSGRRLIADPGNIEIDLNQTKSEFIPIVGDYLELETKSEIDEDIINLNGKVLEVIKVRPVRAHMKEGTIRSFNDKRYTGVVNRDIFFNKEALINGYIPKVGDKVVVEIIESNQNENLWRAIKVMLQSAVQTNAQKNFGDFNKLTKYEHCYDGVYISDNIKLEAKHFNESHPFDFKIRNEKYEPIALNKITIEGSMQQTKLQKVFKAVVLAPSECVTISFVSVTKSTGKSRETILFHFDNVIVGRVVSILLDSMAIPEVASNNMTNAVARNTQYTHMKRFNNITRQPIRGEPLKQAPRFVAKKLNDWRIPTVLTNLYVNYEDINDFKQNFSEALLRNKPCLGEVLNINNYEDRFHTLLFLEELHHVMSMRKYDLERACFIVDGSFLILEMPGLAENRPSVIIGDKVIATCLSSQTPYEGFVHQTLGDHLKLKFSSVFHQQYKGEDYKIHVESSRTTFRRSHQAVFLAVRDLADILFCTHVQKKKPQVKFTFDPYEDIISTSGTKMMIRECPRENKPKKRLSKVEMIKKMNAKVNGIPVVESNDNNDDGIPKIGTKLLLKPVQSNQSMQKPLKYEFKLEWFDKCLNYYQKEAVRNILLGEARPLPYIIFGPPGTGKTVTLIECILQILRMITKSRLLIATPSNSAANLLTLRLISCGALRPGDLVRLVSYKSLQDGMLPPSILPYCATASIAREGTIDGENFVTAKGYVTDMTASAIGRTRITIGTCKALGVMQLIDFKKGHFTHVIVDEAGQCTEAEIMIPLSYVDVNDGQIILAGDPMQLGPVVLSDYAKKNGLEDTYMDRLIHRVPYIRDMAGFPKTGGYDPRLVTKLLYNYRALPDLLIIPNNCFYHNELRATISETDSEEATFLANLSEMLPVVDGKIPSLIFYGCNGVNQRGEDIPSWYNADEASQVFFYVNELYRLGVKQNEIGIITPYIKQVRQIREIFKIAEFDIPKTGTVEEFQGLEFKVIILSTVRTSSDDLKNDKLHVLGFVTNPRRFNVSLTRSQCLTIVIGNPALLINDRHWGMVLAHCRKNGTYVGGVD